MNTGKVIELDPEGYIAKGNGSLVFLHPTDPGILLKVPRDRRQKRLRRRISAVLRPGKRRFGKYREWYREYEEYIAAVCKAGTLPRCLPEPRGFVDTSLGPAYAVEKISDEGTGALALTVEAYLDDFGSQDLEAALNRFFDEVERYRIIFFDLKLYNLCVIRDVSGKPVRVVSIDSIGENTLLQTRKWSARAYEYWLKRAREDFMDRVFGQDTPDERTGV